MKSYSSGSEKRRFMRFTRDVLLFVRSIGEAPEMNEHASSRPGKDIGGGGLCFHSPKSYPKHQRLELDIRMGQSRDAPQIRAIAEVAWTRPAGDGHDIGIRFLDIREKEYQQLKRFLRQTASAFDS